MGFYDDYKLGTDGDDKAKFWKCIAITLIIVLITCLLIQGICIIRNSNQNEAKIEQTNNDELRFEKISKDLVYDVKTNIVYIKNHISNTYSVYSPYYASNGMPFRYNVQTGELEQIELREWFGITEEDITQTE